ncbi:MAG TPA: MFS transporter, partial [Gammaproteobacteria bacterium]|nr:MFS transporter [Gammaproteobacteria bacterium]
MQYTLKQKRNITLLLALVPFLMGIGIDLYVPSLPAIAHDYQVDNTLVQLTISIYMLGYALGQIFLGVISDSLGRKKVILFSGVFYTLISLLSAYSSDISILILLRFLQGIGIAGLGVVARAIATDCFQDLDLTKAMATFSLSWALGPILGPFIGGYIQDYFNWQVDFYLFAVYGGVISIFIAMTLPETQHEVVSMNFSNILQRFKMILLDPIFLLGSLVASLAYSVLVIFNVIGPFLVQDILKYSAIDY